MASTSVISTMVRRLLRMYSTKRFWSTRIRMEMNRPLSFSVSLSLSLCMCMCVVYTHLLSFCRSLWQLFRAKQVGSTHHLQKTGLGLHPNNHSGSPLHGKLTTDLRSKSLLRWQGAPPSAALPGTVMHPQRLNFTEAKDNRLL